MPSGEEKQRCPHATSAAGGGTCGCAGAAAASARRCASSSSCRAGVPRSASCAAVLNSSFCSVASAPRSSSSCMAGVDEAEQVLLSASQRLTWCWRGAGHACKAVAGCSRPGPAACSTLRPIPHAYSPSHLHHSLVAAPGCIVQRRVPFAVAAVNCGWPCRRIQQHCADVGVAARLLRVRRWSMNNIQEAARTGSKRVLKATSQ